MPCTKGQLAMPLNSRLGRKIRWCDFWDSRGAEIINSLFLVAWGVWLVIPTWDAFALCPHIYVVLEAVMTDQWWGGIAFLCGLLKFLVIWRNSTAGRKWLALICGVYWMIICLSVGYSDYRSARFPMFAVLAFNMFRVFFCIRLYQKK